MRTALRHAGANIGLALVVVTGALVGVGVGVGQGASGAPVAIAARSLTTNALYPGGAAGSYTVTFGLPTGNGVAYITTLRPHVSIMGARGTCDPGWFSAADIAVNRQVHDGDTATGSISFINRSVDQAGCSGAKIDITFPER